jgi:hypothetical protein
MFEEASKGKGSGKSLFKTIEDAVEIVEGKK